MSVLKLKDKKTGAWMPVTTIRGEDGNGISYSTLNDDYTLTLVFDDGSSFTTPSIRGVAGETGAKGDKGDNGETGLQGAPGYSPVRGVDYWTEEDKATMDADIAEALAKRGQLKPEFANSTAECTDTSKLYVLPDGNIYAHMTKEVLKKDNYYKADEVTLNTRISSSGGNSSANGIFTTGYIPVSISAEDPYEIIVPKKYMSAGMGSIVNGCQVVYYDATAAKIGNTPIQTTPTVNTYAVFHEEGDDLVLHIGYAYNSTAGAGVKVDCYDDIAFIRIGFIANTTGDAITEAPEDCYVYLKPLITNGVVTDWMNTGHAFVPADYEDRILALEEQAASSENSVSVPDYWENPVNTAVAKVKALQDDGGKDVVNFLWFSDMHHNPGNSYTKNIGTLCAAVMEKCDIPLCLMTGDTMSADSVRSEEILLKWLEDAAKVLSPIGDGLLQIRGNHDDVYGTYTADGTTKYYVNKVSSQKIWNRMFRRQSGDFRRVFGGNGTYFYLDAPAQKVRFICLNGQYYEGDGCADGTTGATTSGFGTEQLNWLRDVALSVSSGWSVVIATHIPPTAQAINTRTDYLASYSDGEAFRSVIGNSDADIIGIFCGHCHADAIVENDLPCPILTVTCAGTPPYDGTSRTAETDKETAIDIVSINKATKTIYTTRLGAGSDRAISY